MTVIRWLITLPVVVVAVAFCVANTKTAAIVWSPLHEAVEVPLYVIGLGALTLGFVWGVLLMGLQALRLRLEARRQRKTIQRLEKQLANSTSAPASASHTGTAHNQTATSREPAQQHIEELPRT